MRRLNLPTDAEMYEIQMCQHWTQVMFGHPAFAAVQVQYDNEFPDGIRGMIINVRNDYGELDMLKRC